MTRHSTKFFPALQATIKSANDITEYHLIKVQGWLSPLTHQWRDESLRLIWQHILYILRESLTQYRAPTSRILAFHEIDPARHLVGSELYPYCIFGYHDLHVIWQGINLKTNDLVIWHAQRMNPQTTLRSSRLSHLASIQDDREHNQVMAAAWHATASMLIKAAALQKHIV